MNEAIDSEPDGNQPPDLLWMGILVEGGMIVLAVVLGWFGFCDPDQSLLDFGVPSVLGPALVWGIAALVPMLLLLTAVMRLNWKPFASFRQTIEDVLVPLFRDCSRGQILLISLLAGLGEELLFRWSLQGGLAAQFEFPGGEWIAAVVAGFIFGLCHWITPFYALWAFVIGTFLGFVMIVSGTYLAPALAHAAFDYVALCIVVKMGRIRTPTEVYDQ